VRKESGLENSNIGPSRGYTTNEKPFHWYYITQFGKIETSGPRHYYRITTTREQIIRETLKCASK
jgi:hypothetical protein